ncbi:MAG: WxcM-like domain-containing protein [Clostridiaceae bacterium]|nr:WxcM-like domain-containing protein [Clostridiaceae bacterium]
MTSRYEVIKISPFEDERGELKKVFTKKMLSTNEAIEEIYVLHTKENCIRGNHYHKKNVEFFSVIKGTATIALRDLETGITDVFRVSSEDNIVIRVPENTVHGFRNDEEDELVIVAIASRQYDLGDTDTYPFRLF